jgi:hypothetical protein
MAKRSEPTVLLLFSSASVDGEAGVRRGESVQLDVAVGLAGV